MKMRKTKTLFLICAIGTFLVSCQKESSLQGDSVNNVNNAILGKWNFVGMVANFKSSVTTGIGPAEEKIISSYGFISQNNTGTVTIDDKNITSTALGYSIDTVVNTEFYLGGVLIDEFETEFEMEMPLSNGATKYKAIGTDSVYFESGFVTLDPSGGGTGTPTATIPTGSRISWSNDTLVLKTIVSNSTIQNVNGVSAKVTTNISQIVKLKK